MPWLLGIDIKKEPAGEIVLKDEPRKSRFSFWSAWFVTMFLECIDRVNAAVSQALDSITFQASMDAFLD
jgi:hypothetical protein